MRNIALLIAIVMLSILSTAPTKAEDGYGVLSTPILRQVAPSFKWKEIQGMYPALAERFRIYLETNYEEKSRDLDFRFAGKYMVAMVGGGGYITHGLLVDLETGEPVIRLPDTSSGYKFYPDRHLMVVNPFQEDGYQTVESSTDYYLWVGEKLILLAEEPWADPTATGSID